MAGGVGEGRPSPGWLRSRPCAFGVVALASAAAAVGCGGQSVPAPVPVQQLLSDALTSGGSGRSVSVLTATGTGSRRFASPLPRRIGVELSCRGGHSVRVLADGHDWVKVFCAPGQSGGSTQRFSGRPRLSLVTTRRTRWSLVVIARAP